MTPEVEALLEEIRALDMPATRVAMAIDYILMARKQLHMVRFGWSEGDMPLDTVRLATTVDSTTALALEHLHTLNRTAEQVTRRLLRPILHRLVIVGADGKEVSARSEQSTPSASSA